MLTYADVCVYALLVFGLLGFQKGVESREGFLRL